MENIKHLLEGMQKRDLKRIIEIYKNRVETNTNEFVCIFDRSIIAYATKQLEFQNTIENVENKLGIKIFGE